MKVPEGLYFHPIFVHFPQALFPVAFGSFLLYAWTGAREIETGTFLIAAFGTVLSPLTAATGFADWKVRYQGYMTSVFKIKITGSFVLMGLAASAVLLRFFVPAIAKLPLSGPGWVYAGLLAACTGTCVVLGHYGGKLVFH